MVPVVRYLTEGIYWLVMLDPEEAEKCRKSAIFGGPKIGSVDARALHFLPASPGRRNVSREERRIMMSSTQSTQSRCVSA